MRILVLGCGPAGLMAAQGAWDATGGAAMIDILSRKQKSDLFGAQYLHLPIPGATPDTGKPISYTLRGSADDYRRKVYGQMWSGSVSPEDLLGEHMGWDIRATYDALWRTWESCIANVAVDTWVLKRFFMEEQYDLVINSIPRPVLCHGGHNFGATEIVAAGDAPAAGININQMFKCPDDMVVCNGEDNPAWYRMSRVFGHTTVEWPAGMRVPVNSAAVVKKPIGTDCTCWPGMMHVGRYGTWEKGVLSHSAYFNAYKRIDNMLGGNGAAEEG